ncbi:MAG: LPS export ABC transporter periplasmic protein LptC [Proteobacteria bacterium]|nr:LPS export ABC transporter periplasmic protein LptC [Pseudomonadota bacterium]
MATRPPDAGGAGLQPALPRRAPLPWTRRALDVVSAYLPLVLMAVLALGTWWLVKNTPLFESGRAVAPPIHIPDYTMTQFLVQRFAPDGAMRAQIEGDLLRHYPDTDTLEIDNPRIRAVASDGLVTRATARRALSNSDGSEVQLLGDAHVVREAAGGEPPIEFRGEFLHAFVNLERVSSNQPVVVTQGESVVRAAAMEYDNLTRIVTFRGKSKAVFTTPARPGGNIR